MRNVIIVTGGAGFIGSNLIERLVKEKKNIKIISIDNYSSGKSKNHILDKRVIYLKGDTNDISYLLKKVKKNIQCIFHFGEYARIHNSFYQLEKCFNSNFSGTQKVLNFCIENKIKIIYSATSASLGNKGEDQNLSPYAFSKSKNLKLIINLNKWFGLKYEILYFFNVYGPKQISTGSMSTVIGIFEQQYKKNLKLTVVKPGNQSRKFTHIDDTVNGCIRAWKSNKNREYILCNNKTYSVLQVAKMFSNKIRMVPARKGERNHSTIIKNIGKRKIYIIQCNKRLDQYIQNFKQKLINNNATD